MRTIIIFIFILIFSVITKAKTQNSNNLVLKEMSENLEIPFSGYSRRCERLNNSTNIIKNTDEVDLRLYGLQFAVAVYDEPNGNDYNWENAKKICEDKGMSLPTIKELGAMYCHASLDVDKSLKDVPHNHPKSDPGCKNSIKSNSIKNLSKGWYWSSDTHLKYFRKFQSFDNGLQHWIHKHAKGRVRCIRRFKNIDT